MSVLANMPFAGIVVIIAIVILFGLAVILLFHTYLRYKHLARMVNGPLNRENPFLRNTVNQFAEAYAKYGQETNTPAIISDSVATHLSGLMLCERFISNAVSLFVTLGLFGTFLGLSLSVSSLTELISYSNTSEWLSVLDSVGGGLMSALSGMGVAFYTSLVGVACSIILTILRSIFSPQSMREKLETRLELWLDHTISPNLPTNAAKDDVELVHQMIGALDKASEEMSNSLKNSTNSIMHTLEASKVPLDAFNKTVTAFNSGVRDFSEFNYNLRGTVERMDVSVREVVAGMREVSREIERSGRK